MKNIQNKSKRIPNYISNCRVKMERLQCLFCKINGSRTPPSFTTTWSAIWHYSHFHKDEPRFEDELTKLKKFARNSNSVGKMTNRF